MNTGGVHAMHDPTEGGLITGLREIATAAGTGIRVDAGAIPVLPETRVICDALKLDPLGLIASGALLAAVAPDRAARLLDAYHNAGIVAAAIGELTRPNDGMWLEREGERLPLPLFDRDEIARYFSPQ